VHRRHYKALRRHHAHLFADIRTHRSRSTMARIRKLLYAYVYGWRRGSNFERRVKARLDRLGIWTLRR
jgi:hypothetical protein